MLPEDRKPAISIDSGRKRADDQDPQPPTPAIGKRSTRCNQHSRRRFLAYFFGMGTSIWTAAQRSGYDSGDGQQAIRNIGQSAWRRSIERKEAA